MIISPFVRYISVKVYLFLLICNQYTNVFISVYSRCFVEIFNILVIDCNLNAVLRVVVCEFVLEENNINLSKKELSYLLINSQVL